MDHPILQIIMRTLHITSAVLAVGGLCFIPLVLRPSLRLVDDTFRKSIEQLVQTRFHQLLWICIAGLTVSGVYNWILNAPRYKELGPIGNALIGTKVLLALIMFAVVAGRSTGYLTNAKRWQLVNIHLAAGVLILGAVLRVLVIRMLSAAH
jgi:uncharacterized membrane protein